MSQHRQLRQRRDRFRLSRGGVTADPATQTSAPGHLIRIVIETDQPEVVDAIKAILPQDASLSTLRSSSAESEMRPSGQSTPQAESILESLTARQTEVLVLLCRGYSNKQIGRELVLSHYTVRNHVSQLFRMLGVTNRKLAAERFRSWSGGKG
ncbi:MAG TPA: LuxR C-terminal-related transcriptional regulator [Novosphingobium sp.]|nr:LuxR C-terminal-related transcriptional regulator [Novosphingobium sp.]HQA17105.1 LuxR C-terminal-related transcriptional regulator [Novosphingobium sp.]